MAKLAGQARLAHHLDQRKLGANSADYQGVQGQSDRFYCDQGGYIENFSFNPEGYRLSSEALNGLDDSFLWALDTSRKALEDAGVALSDSHTLQRTGVIMGALSFPTARSNDLFLPIYHSAVEKALQHKLANPAFSLNPTNADSSRAQQGQAIDVANGAIAHNTSKVVADALGLGAAQLSLDAACASSVYSLKLACDYLTTGKADVMLAGRSQALTRSLSTWGSQFSTPTLTTVCQCHLMPTVKACLPVKALGYWY